MLVQPTKSPRAVSQTRFSSFIITCDRLSIGVDGSPPFSNRQQEK
jgi:hypothetical protein